MLWAGRDHSVWAGLWGWSKGNVSHGCSFSEAYNPIDKKIVTQTIKTETGLEISGKRKSDIHCDEAG